MRRLRSGRPVVNLSLLLDDVLGDRKPLEWEQLGRTPAPVHVVATDTADLTAHTLTGMESVADWRVVLQASASIPLLAGPPVAWGGRHWVDGSVGEPLAIERALRGGATHVLVMLCRGAADLHEDADAGLSLWARTLDRLVPGLGTVAQGSRRYGLDLRLVVAGSALGGHLCAIGPARSAGMSPTPNSSCSTTRRSFFPRSRLRSARTSRACSSWKRALPFARPQTGKSSSHDGTFARRLSLPWPLRAWVRASF